MSVTLFELIAWPLLAAGFATFFRGPRTGVAVFLGGLVLVPAAVWLLAPPSRPLIETTALWTLALGVAAIPAAGYRALLRRARAAADRRGEDDGWR